MARLMLYTPRTIALICELFHPPIQPDASPIQRVHNQLYQSGDPLYSSFSVTPAGAVLSNPVNQPGANSFVAFLADRFQFREELSSLTYDDFATRVRSISQHVSRERKIQVFTGQQVTVRTLVNPRSFKDSRAYLKNGMFGFDDETDVFGREPQLYGIRMVFPATPENPGSHLIRIESFHNDPRSLFIENTSSYGPILVQGGHPGTENGAEGGLEQLEANILASYRFVTDQTMRFIGGFDTNGAGPEEA